MYARRASKVNVKAAGTARTLPPCNGVYVLPPIEVETLQPMYITCIEHADIKKRRCETWLSQKTSGWDGVGKINTTGYGDMVPVTLVTAQRLLILQSPVELVKESERKESPAFHRRCPLGPLGPLGSLAGEWIQNQIIGHI